MSERTHSGRRRAASVAAVMVATVTTLLWLFVSPASAESSTVGTGGEAWYTVLPCAPATGTCVPTEKVPPVQPFPAGTLHVARAAGTELMRTYLKLDLSNLPSGVTMTGGTLTLPIASGPEAGTLLPEKARIQACFMVNQFQAGAFGVIAPPPAPDCFTSATATLVTLPTSSAFVVDLAPFVERWAEGEPNNGIALVPASLDATEPPVPAPVTPPAPVPSVDDTWGVAFNGHDSLQAAKISATITYTLGGLEPLPPAPVPPLIVPGVPGYFVPPAPALVPQQPPPVSRQIPTVLVATRGFQYAAVFVLPLVGMAIGTAVSYSLTRELDVR